MQRNPSLKRASYGIDAPVVVRNLLVAALAVFLIVLFFPVISIARITIEMRGFIWSGISLAAGAAWMLVYSVYGKYKHRDRMLNLLSWTGTEYVLDVGTGRGLLMTGAAKRLTKGKVTGIDIWNAEDLTGNNALNALNNVMAEGVRGKVEVLNENAMQMTFGDESFDVVLSNECLHNIYNKAGRAAACLEIVRVLKPGGSAVISDHTHILEYKSNFEKAGLKVSLFNKYYAAAYPPLRILHILK